MRPLPVHWLAGGLLLLAASAAAPQAGPSQARLQEDCLERLRPLVPAGAQVQRVDFSALGNYASYYVVSYRFTADLPTRHRTASCTYRRDGQWVRDDAAAWKLARELAPRGAAAKPD